jgi:hypothetical protein
MKPFNEGYKAFKEGNLDNPYKKNTKENREWDYGFTKAYFANLERNSLGRQAERRSFEVQGSG